MLDDWFLLGLKIIEVTHCSQTSGRGFTVFVCILHNIIRILSVLKHTTYNYLVVSPPHLQHKWSHWYQTLLQIARRSPSWTWRGRVLHQHPRASLNCFRTRLSMWSDQPLMGYNNIIQYNNIIVPISHILQLCNRFPAGVLDSIPNTDHHSIEYKLRAYSVGIIK